MAALKSEVESELKCLADRERETEEKVAKVRLFSWFVRLLKLESFRNYTACVAASNVYCFTYYLWWYLGGWLVAVGSINQEGREQKQANHSSSSWLPRPAGFCHPVSLFILSFLFQNCWHSVRLSLNNAGCWFVLQSWCGRGCWQKKTRGNLCPVWASLRDGTSLARRVFDFLR